MFRTIFRRQLPIIRSLRLYNKDANNPKVYINEAGIPNHDQMDQKKITNHGIRTETASVHEMKIIRQEKVKQGKSQKKEANKNVNKKIPIENKSKDYFGG